MNFDRSDEKSSKKNACFKKRSNECVWKIDCRSYTLQLINFSNVPFYLIDFWNTLFHLTVICLEESISEPKIRNKLVVQLEWSLHS